MLSERSASRDLPDRTDGLGEDGGRRSAGPPARCGDHRAGLDDALSRHGHRHGQADDGRARGVPHHLIDVLDPWESASVAHYRQWAIEAMEGIEERGKRTLFVGGTALYLKTLLRGLFEGRARTRAFAAGWRRRPMRRALERLHQRLTEVDPRTAAAGASSRPPADRPGARGDRAVRPAAQPAPGRARSPCARGDPGLRPASGPVPSFTTGSIAGWRRCSTRGWSRRCAGLQVPGPAAEPRGRCRAWGISRCSTCWPARRTCRRRSNVFRHARGSSPSGRPPGSAAWRRFAPGRWPRDEDREEVADRLAKEIEAAAIRAAKSLTCPSRDRCDLLSSGPTSEPNSGLRRNCASRVELHSFSLS